MCAQGTEKPDIHPPTVAGPTGRSAEPNPALADLAEALAARKVEPICAAYISLRRNGRSMSAADILEGLNGTAGGSAEKMIISAFSHRRCFMCEDGFTPCRTCDGAGIVNDYPCPGCDGLGVEVCSFCQGTGWSDAGQIPAEVLRAAVHRRIRHVSSDLKHLNEILKTGLPASIERLGPEKRRELTSRLLRLRARLANLANAEIENNGGHAAAFQTAESRIGQLLKALQPTQTNDGTKQLDR